MIIKSFLLFFMIVSCTYLFAQDTLSSAKVNPPYPIGPDGKKNLKGLWIASCPFEYMDQSSARKCALCNRIPDSAHPDDKTVLPLKIVFEYDSIKLNNTNLWHALPYSMDPYTHEFQFKLNETEYKFRVFYSGRQVILENSDG